MLHDSHAWAANCTRGLTGGSIPFACQDWAKTKAAYRFFANDRVEEADILRGHFAATRARYDDGHGPILLIQDTTEFSYQRACALRPPSIRPPESV